MSREHQQRLRAAAHAAAVERHRLQHHNRARCNDDILKPGFDLSRVTPHDGGKLGDATCHYCGALLYPSEAAIIPRSGDGLEAPEITIVTVSNLDLPATTQNEEQEGVTALMLDGFSYPLYRHLRKIGYDFYRGVHSQEGINRWCRIVKGATDAAAAERATIATLKECGWAIDTAAGNATDWEDDM